MQFQSLKLNGERAVFTVKNGEATYQSSAKTTEQYVFGQMIRRIEYVTDFYAGFREQLRTQPETLNNVRMAINDRLREGI